ncbi:Retrovirus-related Pol polyprotein from transposon 17.6 [Trichinella nativa]|uniref:Retrovirus-related Pol polyprotein from transposon 17.6 n=1 Tax=Trichinella nativa TaxID=6335 RepID=A0A0V1KLU7_9BILA|nr:Retrovirus-related Pol polyprotein from transposon 17.6 [Trichinella nativa]
MYASGDGLGAVLSQKDGSKERVVAYESRSLTKPERRYCVTRREMLRLVWALQEFRHYLYERQVARWLESLVELDFVVEHRPGRLHGNADALSRTSCAQCGEPMKISMCAVRALLSGCPVVAQTLRDKLLTLRCMPTMGLFSVSTNASSTSTLICVSFRRKLFDNCSLFHNLVLIPIIAENPISHMYGISERTVVLRALFVHVTNYVFSSPLFNCDNYCVQANISPHKYFAFSNNDNQRETVLFNELNNDAQAESLCKRRFTTVLSVNAKCHLFQERLKWLSCDGVQTDPEKIKAVEQWPIPKCSKELQQYLGVASTTVGECDKAFLHLKAGLTEQPVLTHPDFKIPFLVDTDASDDGLGAVLSQDIAGKEHEVLRHEEGNAGPGKGAKAIPVLFLRAKIHSQN